ncbi:MAG: aspartate aminotransferase family protein [Candidatus Hodarchaeales archaeon]|jgi:glutamate-1-semialdehyde 2,1-aminomutase
MFLKEELDAFYRKRPLSNESWQRSIRTLPGGISHNIRNFGLPSIGAYPVFIRSAQGPYVRDVDGIEYTDYWIGHFAMMLGHNHPAVQEVILELSKDGWHFGTITENQVLLGETLIRDNKGIEKVRFCTSGTEATMYATRLARAFTGRKLVAKAKMGWHGPNDTLFYGARHPFSGKDTPGILEEDQAGVITFEINNEASFDLIERQGKDLAAVILEPVLGGGGGFAADIEFLKRLREETERLGILLIFDEVITGYRFNYGLYQDLIKVIPDLTTMGKVVGGGLPIGVVGGRDDIIEQANPLSEKRVWIGGGTFSGYPLTMAAGLKTLELLKKSSQEYQRINQEGTKLLNELNRFFTDEKFPIIATGYKSVVMLHVLNEWVEEPTIKDIIELTDRKREALLQLALLNRNIVGLHGIGALSMAHTKQHVEQVQQVVKEIAYPISQTILD